MRFLFVFLLLICLPAHAASIAQTDHLRVQLLADKTAIAPGGTVTLAIVEDIKPTWHTYWQNPGDSGLAPMLAWQLPPGFEAGPILFPPPQRLAFGPLVNFGYSDHVTLLTDVTVPRTAMPGSTAAIQGHFKWLVCQETCIPEDATLDLLLPVATVAADDIAQFEMFAKARGDLPQPYGAKTVFGTDKDNLTLSVQAEKPEGALFFPYKSAVIDADAPQILRGDYHEFTLAMAKGDLKTPLKSLDGVLEISTSAGGMRGFTVEAPFKPGHATSSSVPAASLGLAGAALLALLGGMVLNLMPCVFPFLSFKLLALARHAHEPRRDAILGSLAYTAGILVCFGVLAGALIGLQSAGNAIGWGFQLQSSLFVLILAWLIFTMALSLSGLFSIGERITGVGSSLAVSEGYAGPFFTGALAAVVATPCSAPFMGTAIGFASTQPWPVAFLVIECVGLGLALPYLILSLTPALVRHLPRPGAWMETLKQFLAFPLYASAVWLVWVLSIQAGSTGILLALAGCVLIGFGAWAAHVTANGTAFKRRVGHAILLIALAGIGAAAVSLYRLPVPTHEAPASAGWEAFSTARLADLRKSGTPVFVDMTAAWCITCMMNERLALREPELQDMKRHGIVLLRGDWTNQNPEITAFLSGFGRVLPQILTPDIVLDAINGH
jgi:thiol:disulfide interchange protein DsbD